MNIYGKRKIYYIIISFTFILIGFGSGYLTGRFIHKPEASDLPYQKESTSIETYRPKEEGDVSSASEQIDVSGHYFLKNENDILRLYSVEGETETVIKEATINSEFLPVEDLKKLNRGIAVDTLEEGYRLIEDFIS